MPIIKSAKKAHAASLRKRVFNDRRRKDMRTSIKELRKLISAGDTKKAEALLSTVYKTIDKAEKRGVIKKNTASRKKALVAKWVSKGVK